MGYTIQGLPLNRTMTVSFFCLISAIDYDTPSRALCTLLWWRSDTMISLLCSIYTLYCREILPSTGVSYLDVSHSSYVHFNCCAATARAAPCLVRAVEYECSSHSIVMQFSWMQILPVIFYFKHAMFLYYALEATRRRKLTSFCQSE